MEFKRSSHRKVAFVALGLVLLSMLSLVAVEGASNIFTEDEALNMIYDAASQLSPEKEALIMAYSDEQIIEVLIGSPEGQEIVNSLTREEKDALRDLGNILEQDNPGFELGTDFYLDRGFANMLFAFDENIIYAASDSPGSGGPGDPCRYTEPNGCWPEDEEICNENTGGTKACVWKHRPGTQNGCMVVEVCTNGCNGNQCA